MASDSDKPAYTQLRKGRWFWEPPSRVRKAHGLHVHALGADQANAWATARKLNAEMAAMKPTAGMAGSIRWVFDQFFASNRFSGLAPSTQGDYRWLAKRLCAVEFVGRAIGQINIRAIKPRHADKIYEDILKASGHHTAHYCVRFARRVWKWAVRQEHADDNPWREMELRGLPERDETWLPTQVGALIQTAIEVQRPSIGLAVLIAYCLGHRQADVLGLQWPHLEEGLRKTRKTGVTVPIVAAAYPELEQAIARERARQAQLLEEKRTAHVVVCEMTGRPWQVDTFRHEFRRIAKAAGIPPQLQFRDLRATAVTELKDAGADILDLSTHTGHQTASMARRYARRTPDQFKRAAALRVAARNKDATE